MCMSETRPSFKTRHKENKQCIDNGEDEKSGPDLNGESCTIFRQ